MGRTLIKVFAALLAGATSLTSCGGTAVGPGEGDSLVLTTLAGSDDAGFVNGVGSVATFSRARGLAVDGAGTIYVADSNNGLIRLVSPTGVVSTLAGRAGLFTFSDGIGTNAGFSGPTGVALDAQGNVFVADRANERIRKIAPGAVVTTFAGSGERGLQNGTGSEAEFHWPWGIALDAIGNLYISEPLGHRIRKISPEGVVVTFAGSGTRGYLNGAGTVAQFDSPGGIAVDADGIVYVADSANDAIRRISPTGDVTTLAGGPPGEEVGSGLTMPFALPLAVAVDAAGTVYVADTRNYVVRRISRAGEVSTVIGTGVEAVVDGPADIASFIGPVGITLDPSGNIYVVDGGQRIRKISRR